MSTGTYLAYILTVLHFITGFGFLFRIRNVYHPDAYMIGALNAEKPGDGSTEFEKLAHFIFGLCYTVPFVAVIYAERNGSKHAKRTASLFPILYHVINCIAALTVFPGALNPEVAPLSKAFGLHSVFAILCYGLWHFATDTQKHKKR